MTLPGLFLFRARRFGGLDRGWRDEQDLGQLLGRRVDHLAVERCGALDLSISFLQGNEDALGTLDFLRCRRIDFVGELDLRGMNSPLSFHAQRRTATRRGLVAFRIVDAAERPVNWS